MRSAIVRSGEQIEVERLAGVSRGTSSWPTPTARDHMPAHSPEYISAKRAKGHGMANLNDVVTHRERGLWAVYPPLHGIDPALLARDGLLTTPCASDTGHRKRKYAQGGSPLSYQVGGELNPTWVEWLMGFPMGWTELPS